VPRLIGPTRFLLTAMLVVAIPLCCCRGQMWSSLFTAASVCSESHAGGGSHGGVAHGHADEHGSDHRSAGCGNEDREPCDDDGPCDCGHQRDIKSLPEAPTSIAAGSTALVAILPALDGAISPAIRMNARTRLPLEAAPRPPTTLLRLHCALII